MATPRLSWLWRQAPVRDRTLLLVISPRCWPSLLRLRHRLGEADLANRVMPPERSRRAEFARYLHQTGRLQER